VKQLHLCKPDCTVAHCRLALALISGGRRGPVPVGPFAWFGSAGLAVREQGRFSFLSAAPAVGLPGRGGAVGALWPWAWLVSVALGPLIRLIGPLYGLRGSVYVREMTRRRATRIAVG
jgi:hypothetical protein